MEDNVQRVFSILIAMLLFFLVPMYMAFEKKDDISYALALKITSSFVENVKEKGYISRKMYDDFISQLALTDNTYEIKLEHVSKKYVPAIYVYNDQDNSILNFKLDYNQYKDEYINFMENGKFKIDDKEYKNVILSYDLEEEIISEKQIEEVLDRTVDNDENKLEIYKSMDRYQNLTYYEIPYIPNMYGSEESNNSIYTMSIGDEFNVIVKNTNKTIASVLFDTFALGLNNNNIPKVYINYGGVIKGETYRD